LKIEKEFCEMDAAKIEAVENRIEEVKRKFKRK